MYGFAKSNMLTMISTSAAWLVSFSKMEVGMRRVPRIVWTPTAYACQ